MANQYPECYAAYASGSAGGTSEEYTACMPSVGGGPTQCCKRTDGPCQPWTYPEGTYTCYDNWGEDLWGPLKGSDYPKTELPCCSAGQTVSCCVRREAGQPCTTGTKPTGTYECYDAGGMSEPGPISGYPCCDQVKPETLRNCTKEEFNTHCQTAQYVPSERGIVTEGDPHFGQVPPPGQPDACNDATGTAKDCWTTPTSCKVRDESMFICL